ncbi:MAG: phosphatase PAP2 family protein [Bacteroidia bacterium]|nr:phosphatase PAP2 family protein [Bacteroidia bacterium]
MKNTERPVGQNKFLRFWAKTLSFVINPNICQFFLFVYFISTTPSYILNSLLFLFVVPFGGYVVYVRFWLKRSNLYVLERKYRYVPFIMNIASVVAFCLISIFCYEVYARFEVYFLLFINLVAFLITFFWRISIHMLASSAAYALVYYGHQTQSKPVGGVWLAALALLVVAVGWSRYYLRGHTLNQIVGGTLTGFGCFAFFKTLELDAYFEKLFF